MIWLGGVVYWLVWIYRSHQEFQEYTGYRHTISAGKALGYSFIPFFNLFWVCYMPYTLAQGLDRCLRTFGKSFNSSSVLVVQIIGVVAGFCIFPLTLIAHTFTMWRIQRGLNTLWAQADASSTAHGA
jgi:hypothetical protein